MSIKDSDGVVVLGNDSSNPLNNVTIRTPAVPNGSLEVFQGVPGNLGAKILDLNENKIGINTETLETALNQNVLGMGQTWQDMTASRSFGTTYTNTTGRVICVSVYTQMGADNTPVASWSLAILVNGMVVERMDRAADVAASDGSLAAVVPAGSTFRVITSGPITMGNQVYWMELR